MLRLLLLTPLLWAQNPFPGGMPATSAEELPSLERALNDGEWNARIHAVHKLGAMGEAALPSLRLALRDADWQVRFTATHWLGRIGPGAVPALREVLREEPCRIIRITAVHWLGSLGDAMESADSDDSPTVRMSRWYWLRKQGALPEKEESTDASGEDINVCLDAPYPMDPGVRRQLELGMLRGSKGDIVVISPFPENPPKPPPAKKEEPQAVSDMPESDIVLAALAKREQQKKEDPKERLKELDLLLEPETLARPAGIPGHEDKGTGEPAELSSSREEPVSKEESPQPLTGAPEPKLPRPQGPDGRVEKTVLADARLADDHGKKPYHDPLPELIKALKEGPEKLRCRAADELGKRGSSAAEAVPELLLAAKGRSARLRASAALALGNIGKPAEKAVPVLIRLLEDPNADVRYSAAHALAKIGTPKARKAFARYLRRELRRSVR